MATTRRPRTKEPVANENAALVAAIDTEPVRSRSRGLVFVSHDSRDADLAEAFSNLLTDVNAGILKSFCASDKKGASGIPFGTEWYKEIMDQLD